MDKDSFLQALQTETATFTSGIATEEGDWIVKGFIDTYRRIYTVSVDTKVVSKILELLLYPKLVEFADQHDYKLVLAPEQNFYPDLSFVNEARNEKYAVDIKSTYRINPDKVNGMTLGAFTGYFRDRASRKNIVFPYSEYQSHIVLGVIYSKTATVVDERQIHTLENLEKITSVIRDFQFFAQPKYRIASARPGSGNTKNIGSVTLVSQLLAGTGPFAELGEEVYDDYWMYYLTRDMARAVGMSKGPYSNLKTYVAYKQLGVQLSPAQAERLDKLDSGSEKADNNDTAGSTD